MTDFWWGIVTGAVLAGTLGGPIASRLSARLEAWGDRTGERRAATDPGVGAMVDRLASDEALFAAYEVQYWTWAAIVGGVALACGIAGGFAAWFLHTSGRISAASFVAATTAIVVAGIAVFWVRKLVAKRRIGRLVYLRRRSGGR